VPVRMIAAIATSERPPRRVRANMRDMLGGPSDG
jgi:hypothetical protein